MHLFSSFQRKQDRITTCFKTCGPLFWGLWEGAKSLWCQGCADGQTNRHSERQKGLAAPLASQESRNPLCEYFGRYLCDLGGHYGVFCHNTLKADMPSKERERKKDK